MCHDEWRGVLLDVLVLASELQQKSERFSIFIPSRIFTYPFECGFGRHDTLWFPIEGSQALGKADRIERERPNEKENEECTGNDGVCCG